MQWDTLYPLVMVTSGQSICSSIPKIFLAVVTEEIFTTL